MAPGDLVARLLQDCGNGVEIGLGIDRELDLAEWLIAGEVLDAVLIRVPVEVAGDVLLVRNVLHLLERVGEGCGAHDFDRLPLGEGALLGVGGEIGVARGVECDDLIDEGGIDERAVGADAQEGIGPRAKGTVEEALATWLSGPRS
nr:hypothetical protein [Halochromatium salexigens]